MSQSDRAGVTGGLAEAGLRVHGVSAGFGEALILHDVSLTVRPGELVALLGPSGAGKTTLLRAIMGLHPIRAGQIHFGAARLDGLPAHQIATLGVAALPEGRRLFGELSVRENLAIGAYLPAARQRAAAMLSLVRGLFPALGSRQAAAVQELSAGEQQMVAVSRTLMAGAQCLVLDDPLLGLAPPLRARLAPMLRELAASQGLAILSAGQHVRTLLRAAHRAYVLDGGRVVAAGRGTELQEDQQARGALYGLGREAPA